MQEQVTEKTIAFAMRGTKLTGNLLAKAMRKYLSDMEKMKNRPPKTYQGKQSVKALVKQGQGVTNIEITDDNIKSFERVARKYGVDFALKKDETLTPPKWLVFFKSKDADAMTLAFKEFSAETLKEKKKKPSVIEKIKKMKEVSVALDKGRVKNKDMGLER